MSATLENVYRVHQTAVTATAMESATKANVTRVWTTVTDALATAPRVL